RVGRATCASAKCLRAVQADIAQRDEKRRNSGEPNELDLWVGAKAVCVSGNLQAVVQGELLQNVVHVTLDGVGGDMESARDFFVAQALDNQRDHLPLPLRHPYGVAHGWGPSTDRSFRDVGKQRTCQGG